MRRFVKMKTMHRASRWVGLLVGLVLIGAAAAQQGPESLDQFVTNAKQAEEQHDFHAAITWYEKAAAVGDAGSMNELGWIYFGAHDNPGRKLRDYATAAIWFHKAADLNYPPALTQLGVMYGADGSYGVPEDHVKAAKLFLKAAEAGDAQAMDNLGVLYMQGKGVPKDIDEAIRWWEKAVEGGGQSGKAAQTWLDLYSSSQR
jgi:TPR repeat protein